jgi:hypothetical protein
LAKSSNKHTQKDAVIPNSHNLPSTIIEKLEKYTELKEDPYTI